MSADLIEAVNIAGMYAVVIAYLVVNWYHAYRTERQR